MVQSSNPAHQSASEAVPKHQPGALEGEQADLETSTGNLALQDSIQSATSLSTSDIDAYLDSALHQALSMIGSQGTPLSASSLYSGHILPSRAAAIPQQLRDNVVIGNSSWKKLAKWMKIVDKEGLIKAKEGRGGEITITTIHMEHPSIALHRAHKTIAKEEEQMKRAEGGSDKAQAVVSRGETASANGRGKFKEMSIEEIWKPNGPNIAFWEACGVE